MPSANSFVISWPSPELSPNSRSHWGKVSTKKKTYRQAAFVLAKESGLHVTHDGPINVKLTFHPPTNHARDHDNLLASMKSALDGLADAMRVNDNLFRPSVEIGEKAANGFVRIEVSQ